MARQNFKASTENPMPLKMGKAIWSKWIDLGSAKLSIQIVMGLYGIENYQLDGSATRPLKTCKPVGYIRTSQDIF